MFVRFRVGVWLVVYWVRIAALCASLRPGGMMRVSSSALPRRGDQWKLETVFSFNALRASPDVETAMGGNGRNVLISQDVSSFHPFTFPVETGNWKRKPK